MQAIADDPFNLLNLWNETYCVKLELGPEFWGTFE